MGSKHRVDTKDKKRTRKNAEFGREKRNSGNQELSNEPEKDTIMEAYDRKDPIMARNKKVLKQSESEKLEYKAKKALLAEKKKLLGKARKTDIIPIASGEDRSENIRKVLEKETALRKIAQKGAVKLFNAILATQVKTEKEVSENLSGIKNKEEKKELITEVSKEKFLDLVKAAAGSDNE
ncbi:BTE_collapsed_G0057640.mRNA.1.CDS.1 [Saccharomyces cerevisiae]|nr:CPA_1a_G0057190.mRNA.1.CDS.1 [Saccharomyces cerevisiae]CAI4836294.1 AMP_1a_G0056860.mRNA.1.CDS.1 [Saccharomyces cerevisiae]CAI4837575.1 CNB_1a_G0057180.mRNA.1.CDS.1 [Saccharomyces cerevisiae]CAI4853934.1 AGK_G0057490.mRNA.1.CDS.1 [Saccharomyces cerevisiae]CAI5178161.1 BTE_HP_G0134340.mRNA.1.CDS.1 [Saccharomyces cerevisiae]